MRNPQPMHPGAHALRQLSRPGSSSAGKNNRDLFSAISSDRIRGTMYTRRQRGRNRAKTIIARMMTMLVVELFEVVQIDKQQRHLRLLSQGPFPLTIEGQIEAPPVRQACKPIGKRHRKELVLHHGTRRCVAKNQQDLQCLRAIRAPENSAGNLNAGDPLIWRVHSQRERRKLDTRMKTEGQRRSKHRNIFGMHKSSGRLADHLFRLPSQNPDRRRRDITECHIHSNAAKHVTRAFGEKPKIESILWTQGTTPCSPG